MLRHTLGLLTVGGLLLCSAPASAGPFGLGNGGGPFGGGGLFGKKKANNCQPACQPVSTCGTQTYGAQQAYSAQRYVTVAVPNSQLYGQVQQTSYAAPASDCGCSGSAVSQTTYSQPSYSQPTYSQPTYSAPTDGGCSTCGSAPAISYAQPTQSYSVASTGCGTTTSTCGDPCGSVATQGYGQPVGQSYATQSYNSGIVQTSGSDCGCSGSTGVVTSGMTTSNYGPTQSYGQPMAQSYGQPMGQTYGQPMASGTAGCSTCSQNVVDGTQNFGQPVPDQQMQNQSMQNGATNYGSSLQDGGFINEQPLQSTQPADATNAPVPSDDEA